MNIEKIIKKIIKAKLDAPVYKTKEFLDSKEKKFLFVFLSTRTKDEITLEATKRFYDKYNSIWDIDKESELIKIIKPVAFYKTKAHNLYLISKSYTYIPEELDKLLEMPGVGIKVAKVFLASIGKNYIGVDTHVHRISNRLGIVNTNNIKETDILLEKLVPDKIKNITNLHLVALGQTICKARYPKCNICPISEYCKYFLKKHRL